MGDPKVAPKARNPRAPRTRLLVSQGHTAVAITGAGVTIGREGRVGTAVVVVISVGVATPPATKQHKGRGKRRGGGTGVKRVVTKDAAVNEVAIKVAIGHKKGNGIHGVHNAVRQPHGRSVRADARDVLCARGHG